VETPVTGIHELDSKIQIVGTMNSQIEDSGGAFSPGLWGGIRAIASDCLKNAV